MIGAEKWDQNRKHDGCKWHEVEVEADCPATGNLIDYVAALIAT